MARKRFIAQDRWCVMCSRPAALLVVTAHKDDHTLRPVCSNAHGENMIDQLARQDEAEEAGTGARPMTKEEREEIAYEEGRGEAIADLALATDPPDEAEIHYPDGRIRPLADLLSEIEPKGAG